jgi:hypothetical protein
MRYRRAITTALVALSLTVCVNGAFAGRRIATDPQFRPRGDWSVLADARPATSFRFNRIGRLFAQLGSARAVIYSLRQRLIDYSGFDPVPDQQGGGGLDTLGGYPDRGQFDSSDGIAHDPVYIGSGPIGPDPM